MFSTALNAILLSVAALGLSSLSRSSIADASPVLRFSTYVCIALSIAVAPLFLKGLIAIALLTMPTCLHWYQGQQPRCSRFCAARSRCSIRQP
ncbi:MAG TPA: hypothetical protein V6D19_22725 [Stenomitos sp.]